MIGNDHAQHASRAPNLRASRRGLLTILAIFTVGLIFVTGLYIASRRTLPDDYKSSTPGTPSRSLRIASIDLAYDTSKSHLVIDQIYKLKPDFVLLQRVTRHDAYELAQALDMRHGGKVQMFYSPSDPASPEHPGNAILARWPLHQGRTMAKGHPRPFGIFAESIIDHRRFLLGSWHLSETSDDATREVTAMLESWRRTGDLPLILGGLSPTISDPLAAQARSQSSRVGGLSMVSNNAQEVSTSGHWTLRDISPASTALLPGPFIVVEVTAK